MDMTNRKRKREFQDIEESPALNSSLNVENCGLSSIFVSRKRRKSVDISEYSTTCKVSALIDFAGDPSEKALTRFCLDRCSGTRSSLVAQCITPSA